MEQIVRVRQDGYAFDNEENEGGVRCIAVSLADYHKEPVYAVSISAPVNRMTDERLSELKEVLLGLKDEIADILGFAGR